MPTNRIQCPGCQSRFTLKSPSIEALAGKTFRCPKCGSTTPFSRLLGIQPMAVPLHTNIGRPGAVPPPPNNKTRVASGAQTLLTLKVDASGKEFPLGIGTYTLGRDSFDSQASLKIAPDKYMSRLQASIEVTPMGSQLTAINDLNPIMVNGQKIRTGIPVALRNGDKLLLGMTTITVSR